MIGQKECNTFTKKRIKRNSTNALGTFFLGKYWMTNVRNCQLTSSGMPANPAALKP